MRIPVTAAIALVLAAGCTTTQGPHGRESTASPPVPRKPVVKTASGDPGSGFCAQLVFHGRVFEVADGQQGGTGVGRSVGDAQGHSCGVGGDRRVRVYTANEQPPEEALTASYRDRVVVYWPEHSAELVPVPYAANVRQSGQATAGDLALVRDFAQLAVRPTPGYRDVVGFASGGPWIGLGPALRRTPIRDLARASTWSFQARGYAGRVGRVNVLDVLREHLMDTLALRFTRDSKTTVFDLVAFVGQHPGCAAGPREAPGTTRFATLRHLSIQPDPQTLESCLDWFAIDLYLNPSGRVAAVSLDLHEP